MHIYPEKKALKQRFESAHLYCFTPGDFLRGKDPVEVVHAQIKGGADVIQLREKHMPKEDLIRIGLEIREMTREKGVLFIVNDHIDVAVATNADGVHLGQEDTPIEVALKIIPQKLVGISTHNQEQAIRAINSGADYIGVGPIFKTSTKKTGSRPLGVLGFSNIKKISPVPCVAIGGIGLSNIHELRSAGCQTAAVISDIMNAPSIEERCRRIRKVLSDQA